MKISRIITARTGALRGACLCLSALAALATLLPVRAGATAVGRGDFEFYLDSACFRGRDGKAVVQVPIRISNSALNFKESGSEWKNQVKLNILIVDDADKEIVRESERVTFVESDASRIQNALAFQLLIKEFRLPPGGYWMSYAVEDLDAPKLSMVALARKQNKNAVVRRARLNVPEIPVDEPAFSDAWFVWDVDPRGEGVRKYRPNPARMYGLYCDTLTVYLELYLPGDAARAGTFDFRTEIVTPSGEPVRETRRTLENPKPDPGRVAVYPVVVREDVTELLAGSYLLYFTFGSDGAHSTRIKAGEFSVAWDMRTWELPRREFLAEARFLLGDKDFAEFQGQLQGEQERRLDALWKALDPDPTTGNNEAYDSFLDRLAYINAHYTEGGVAILTRRGEMFVRYGAPDEIVQDVIPLNHETLEEAENVVSNPYHPLNMSSSSTKLYATPRTRNSFSNDSPSGRYRSEDNTGVPYELWIYQAGGSPILARDAVQEADGLRFLFVDRDGHGVYKLERSSSITQK